MIGRYLVSGQTVCTDRDLWLRQEIIRSTEKLFITVGLQTHGIPHPKTRIYPQNPKDSPFSRQNTDLLNSPSAPVWWDYTTVNCTMTTFI